MQFCINLFLKSCVLVLGKTALCFSPRFCALKLAEKLAVVKTCNISESHSFPVFHIGILGTEKQTVIRSVFQFLRHIY